MNLQSLLELFGYPKPEKHPAKPKPWEDPKRSQADRQAWLDAQPKSLTKK